MPSRKQRGPAPTPDAELKKDFDSALAAAMEDPEGYLLFARNKGFPLKPQDKETGVLNQLVRKRGMSYEDANYILSAATRNGWYNDVSEKKTIKISQLRNLIREALGQDFAKTVPGIADSISDVAMSCGAEIDDISIAVNSMKLHCKRLRLTSGWH